MTRQVMPTGVRWRRSVTKQAKRTAYLVAVHQRHEAVRVYAVLTQSTAAALAQVGE